MRCGISTKPARIGSRQRDLRPVEGCATVPNLGRCGLKDGVLIAFNLEPRFMKSL